MDLYTFKNAPDEAPVAAVQIGPETIGRAAIWAHGTVSKELVDPEGDEWIVGLNITTPEGVVRVSEPDWVIRDKAGAFHKMPDERFKYSFRPALGDFDPERNQVKWLAETPNHTDVREMRAKQREARDG